MFRVIRILSFWAFIPLLFLPLGQCSLDSAISENTTHFSYRIQGVPEAFNLETFNDITVRVITLDDTPFRYDYIGWGVLITLLISFLGVNLPSVIAWLKPLSWLSLPVLFLAHTLYSAILLEARSITLYGHLFIYIGYVYGLTTLNAYLPKRIRLR